jgi:hypothetical protein
MGYAVLVFPPASSAGQILKGVLKVIMGETNLANIEGLSTAPSTWHAGCLDFGVPCCFASYWKFWHSGCLFKI